MYQNLHICRGVVINLLGFDLTFVYRLQDGVNQRDGRLRERNLADDERLVVEFLNLCPNLQDASPLSVIVSGHVNASASGEVGV